MTPLPPLTVNIARPDMNSTVISVVGNVISLHHDLQKIGGVSTTLSTGGGLMQLGDLRQGVHVFEGGTALLQEHSVDGKKYFAPMLLSVYHYTAHEVRIAGCAWVHVGELLKAGLIEPGTRVRHGASSASPGPPARGAGRTGAAHDGARPDACRA